MVEITSKSYKILESGAAMTVDGDADLRLHFNIQEELEFSISIEFEENDSESEVATFVDKENNVIRMVFQYSLASSSFGLREPMEIAKLNGNTIFFMIWITPLGSRKRLKSVNFVLYEDQGLDE